MTERERFFFPPAADRDGRGECKGAQNKQGLSREEELPLGDAAAFLLFVAVASAPPLPLTPVRPSNGLQIHAVCPLRLRLSGD